MSDPLEDSQNLIPENLICLMPPSPPQNPKWTLRLLSPFYGLCSFLKDRFEHVPVVVLQWVIIAAVMACLGHGGSNAVKGLMPVYQIYLYPPNWVSFCLGALYSPCPSSLCTTFRECSHLHSLLTGLALSTWCTQQPSDSHVEGKVLIKRLPAVVALLLILPPPCRLVKLNKGPRTAFSSPSYRRSSWRTNILRLPPYFGLPFSFAFLSLRVLPFLLRRVTKYVSVSLRRVSCILVFNQSMSAWNWEKT